MADFNLIPHPLTGLGFILLSALFVGSIRLSESISADRYPSYRLYQAATPCAIPGLRMGRAGTTD